MLEVKPLRKYSDPKYPNRDQVRNNPDILKSIPRRWRANPVVLTALGLTITLSSCVRNSITDDDPGSSVDKTEKGVVRSDYTAAPVFEHGGGSGSFGCVSVVAPYFFSEEEALEIIRNEAESYGGLKLDSVSPPEFQDITIKPPFVEPRPVGNKDHITTTIEEQADAWNADKRIALEFVSTGDLSNWMWRPEENEESTWISISTYEFKDTAKNLSTALNDSSPDVNIGVFYDPYSYEETKDILEEIQQKYNWGSEDCDYDAINEEYRERSRAISEENLRAQVRDFIEWLKAQGVI